MAGDTTVYAEDGLLFGRALVGPRERKSPESAEEKRLREIEEMEERDFRNLKLKLNSGKTLTAAEATRLDEYRKKFEAALGRGLPAHVVRTQVEVAGHFRKTVRTIKRWAKRGMPALPEGYDLREIRKWAVREGLIPEEAAAETAGQDGVNDAGGGAGEAAGRGASGETTVADFKRENEKLKLRIKQFEFAQKLGKFVSREEMERENIAKITTVKRALLAMPRALAPRLVGLEAREVEAVLSETVRDIIGRFAGGGVE